MVGGIPLGIELASAWVSMLSPEEIANEIEKNLDFLASSMQDLPDKHRSMRAAFDYTGKCFLKNNAIYSERSPFFEAASAAEQLR